MLHMSRNSPYSDNTLIKEALESLAAQVPPSWLLRRKPSKAGLESDVAAEIVAPDGRTATLVVEARSRLDPKDVERVLARLRERLGPSGTGVVASPYLGERTREKIEQDGASYVDLTGNLLLMVDDPAVFIKRQGADSDPWRSERPARSLKGVKATRVVRALVDLAPPLGVRQLAALAETDPGYVSRILQMLEREDMVRRQPRGPVEEVEWAALLRRWAEDYSVLGSNRASAFLDPRGVESFVEQLRAVPRSGAAALRYALTGSLAARAVAPLAPARMAICFVDDPDGLADRFGLTPTDTGANVLLVEPADGFVYVRTREVDGLRYVALSQAVADLLTGPGRNPAEGEELLRWMETNSEGWRASA